MPQSIRGQDSHLLLTDQSEKHVYKLGSGRWDLASSRFLLNSIQPMWQRKLKSCFLSRIIEFSSGLQRNRKCVSQLKARVAILDFLLSEKTQLGGGRWDLFTVKFRWILFRGCTGDLWRYDFRSRSWSANWQGTIVWDISITSAIQYAGG